MERSRDQFGPEGPEVSTSAACRSPAVRDQAKGRRAAGDPNLKLEAPHGTDSSQTPRRSERNSNSRSPTSSEPVHPGAGLISALEGTRSLIEAVPGIQGNYRNITGHAAVSCRATSPGEHDPAPKN
jgi:hypothetical protein